MRALAGHGLAIGQSGAAPYAALQAAGDELRGGALFDRVPLIADREPTAPRRLPSRGGPAHASRVEPLSRPAPRENARSSLRMID